MEFINNTPTIHRGDIYYITNPYDGTTTDPKPGRPAIIVSNDRNNDHSPSVEVVFLTTQEKKPMPTHVPVFSKVHSTALCENITSVFKERLGTFICKCSDEEMANIDKALMFSLGVEVREQAKVNEQPTPTKVEVERDLYKTLYEQLLEKVVRANA